MIKKGQMVTVVVGLILLVIGALIVFSFLGVSFLNDESVSDETCRLSVLARGTAHEIGRNLIQLKCETKKICITEGKLIGTKDCPQFAGESNVKNVKVNLVNSEEAINIIERESADLMYSCWSNMGEGKIDLFADPSNTLGFSDSQKSCVVCSRLAIHPDLIQNEEFSRAVISNIDIRDYMNRNLVFGTGKTYWDILSGGAPNIGLNLTEINSELKGSSQLAFLFSQIKTANAQQLTNQITGSFAIIGGATFVGPIGRITTSSIPGFILGATTAGVVGGIVAIGQYSTYESSRYVAAGYCGDFVSNDEDPSSGCSVVRMVDWNVNEINDICQKIEGTP